jgi:hypothetical protein
VWFQILSFLVEKENNNACSYENTYLFEKLFRKLRRDFCSGFSVSAIGQNSPVSALMGCSKKKKIRQEYTADHRPLSERFSGSQALEQLLKQ